MFCISLITDSDFLQLSMIIGFLFQFFFFTIKKNTNNHINGLSTSRAAMCLDVVTVCDAGCHWFSVHRSLLP